MQQLTCQNCGDDLQIESQFIRTVTCRSCGTNYLVQGADGLDMTGRTTTLADYPSRLRVGARGKIKGREFTVLGRIRYAYDAGFWEEWQISWADDSPPDWLEEDEGLWTLYRRGRIRGVVPPYDDVHVGTVVNANNQQLFVTEKRKGRVLGSEGQFASVFPITGTFGYVTGAANEQTTSINYWPDEIEISIGEEISSSDLVLYNE